MTDESMSYLDALKEIKRLKEALERQPCEDAISRKDMLAIFRQSNSLSQAWNGFEKLPSVTPKQQPCDDCISRQSLKRKLQENHDFFINAYGSFSNMSQNDKSRVDEIINCIAMVVNEPSVTPKEKSEYEHDHEVVKAYNGGQAYILDKIRAEIEELKKIDEKHQSVIDNIEISETHGMKESNVRVHNPQRERYMKFDGKLSAYDKVLEIIDKYRESEDKE